jgi:hypothetical protein
MELDESNGGPGPIPNNDEGWGRITLTNLIITNIATAPRYYQFLDQSVLLSNGQVYEQHTLVQNSDQPLKITLAYTDVPGFPGAIPALVNDLDLEVVGPDGSLYRGNRFAAGESVPNAPSPDNLNNVEAVHLSQPTPGDYLVRVRARHVVEDARLDTSAIDQDFALVVSGDLARPGAGTVLLDRSAYKAPGLIQLAVFDLARAASNSVNVLLKSTTEPAGETITLHAAGAYGAFTGAVATAVGPAKADGILEIHNGDVIEADYLDSAGAKRTATATADLTAPTLTGVTVSEDLGVTTISWQSSQPANSVVYYGTNGTFNLAVTNADLVTSHSIRLAGLVPGQKYYFYLTSTDEAGNVGTNNNAGANFNFVGMLTPTVLMVDDYDSPGEANAGSTVIDDGSYTNALTTAGFKFAFWKVIERGSPGLSDLQPFPVVIWRTTDDIINYGTTPDGTPDPTATNNTLSAEQQFMIQTYLNGGGSFFMASMGILTQLGNVPFRRDVLQVAGFKQNPDPPAPCTDCDEDFGVPETLGAPGDSITDGMDVVLDYNNYPSFDIGLGDSTVYGPDFSDTFTPTTNATPIFFESVSGKACGMSYPRVGVDSPGRVVFLSFPLDTVPSTGTAPNNETVLLRNILNFLVPGANGVGTLILNSPVYTIPDQVIVELGDSDLVGSGQATVNFSTSSSASKVTLTLNETTHRGLFRGYLTLVATNAAANQLTVRNGDTITAQYYDASNLSNTVATATVDTVAPVLGDVNATTRYGDAQVTWLSSKPADSLVQYGQSVLLDRTAYTSGLTTNHAVTVTGLSANRNYFFQVVSRDEAGNTAVDDNNGALYQFTTRKAPQPPWSDNLETGAPGWTVVPDPGGSDMNWTLGTPNNGLQTQAHSGTNAWGSDLDGQSFGFLANSLLVSPIIDLSGFSKVTLTFWDSFDFGPGSSGFSLEQGEVLVNTNTSATAAELEASPVVPGGDFSGLTQLDWYQESLDLTPYAGQTIQVVWWYQGASIGDPVNGWLVDDVSITGTATGQGGTIIISASLSQASFTVSGPLNANATGTLTLSNAPLGAYTVQFSDVAFYQTPAPAPVRLRTPGTTLTVNGTYNFIDLNKNGISDAWEKYYFGAVVTNRTQYTDTDGDGMSDYAEFLAGTNPTNAASNLKILTATRQADGHVALEWSAVPGRSYQLESSSDLNNWTPINDWTKAVSSPGTFTTTNAVSGAAFFRVGVRP